MSDSTGDFKYSKWVFTVTIHETEIPNTALSEFLKSVAETFAFQLEEGEVAGKTHYQGVLRTPYRVRQQTLLKRFFESLDRFTPQKNIHLERMQGDWTVALAYAVKDETRVDGPWFSDDYSPPYSGDDINFLKNENNRFPWQQTLISKILSDDESTFQVPDDREITWISDSQGCTGKSKFVKYMFIHYPGVTEVAFGSSNQLRTALISIGAKKCYFIDIPRQLGDEDSIATLVSVLEKLKGGFLTSSMYGKFTSLVMQPPHIIIFSNRLPPVNMLSLDRWRLYSIIGKKLYDCQTDNTGNTQFIETDHGRSENN